MKVLCDVHIPLKLMSFLKQHQVEAVHVNQILSGSYSSDAEITAYADKHTFIVVTKDIDFRNSYILKKQPKRLIRICLGNITTAELISIFQKQLENFRRAYNDLPEFYIEVNRDSALTLNS